MGEPYTPVRCGCEGNFTRNSSALFVPSFCGRRRRVLRQSRRSRLALHVVPIPREITLEPVSHMRGNRKFVILARIDHKLRFTSKRYQRLIHLFAADNRYVPVDSATHEECWRRDVFHAIKRGNFVPHILTLPRVPKLAEIVLLILVMSIEAGELRCACA